MRKYILALLLTLYAIPCLGWGMPPQTTAVWWYPGLTFWAPFDDPANPLKLNKGTGVLTFTRATTAMRTAIDNGFLTVTPSGTLRIESNGALIEGQRTNLLKYSEAINNWENNGANTTIASDNTTAPDGATTADRLSRSGGTDYKISQKAYPLDNTVYYTFSIYLKAGNLTSALIKAYTETDGVKILVPVIISGPGSISGNDINGLSSTAWTRVSGTIPAPWTTNGADSYYYVFPNGSTGDGDHMFAWGAQLEAASFASSYIPTTTAAVTRNNDSLIATSTGNFSKTAGTTYMSADRIHDIVKVAAGVYAEDPSGRILYFNNGTDSKVYDGTNISTKTGLISMYNTSVKRACSYSGTSTLCTGDGAASQAGTFDGTMGNSGSTNIFIGNSGATEGEPLWGHIKNLRIWNRSFSDSELQAITQ